MKKDNKKNHKKGIALLFSIMLSTIFLTIAIGVMNITLKELNFASSSKDTNNAFFAADGGIECALYNDKTNSKIFTTETEGKIFCFNDEGIVLNNDVRDPNYLQFDFNILGLGTNGQSCAKVNVLKTINDIDPLNVISTTTITSKGYNIGMGDDCSSGATNQVERVLEVNY